MAHGPTNSITQRHAIGRSIGDFWIDDKEGSLYPAEEKIIAACASGEPCIISSYRPTQSIHENTVRASLIRFLALGGDSSTPVHEHGVDIRGAWVDGLLDLRAANVFPLHISMSRIERIDARRSKLQLLDLEGSYLEHGLYGDRLSCVASIFLRRNFRSGGSIRLVGANIGGTISCSGGLFESTERSVINLTDSYIGSNVSLSGKFHSKGEVVILGARIGGYLNLTNGTFESKEGRSLNLQSINIERSFFIRKSNIYGDIDLSSAKIGSLVDDLHSWKYNRKRIRIDGLVYNRIGGSPAFINTSERIYWLKLQKMSI